MYTIQFKGKSGKQLNRLDKNIRIHYATLFDQIMDNPFIGKLGETTYHAHVKYHWVAVWEVDKNTKTITITYIGSREGAPY